MPNNILGLCLICDKEKLLERCVDITGSGDYKGACFDCMTTNTQAQWVPLSERLPDLHLIEGTMVLESDFVLVCNAVDTYQAKLFASPNYQAQAWVEKYTQEDVTDLSFTHWKPLSRPNITLQQHGEILRNKIKSRKVPVVSNHKQIGEIEMPE